MITRLNISNKEPKIVDTVPFNLASKVAISLDMLSKVKCDTTMISAGSGKGKTALKLPAVTYKVNLDVM